MAKVLLACAFLGAPYAASVASAQTHELTLEVNEQRVIPSAGVSSYSEGLAGVVDVRLTSDGASFVIVGQRPGLTSLLLVMSDGAQIMHRISVVDPAAKPSADAKTDPLRVDPRDNVRLDFYFVQLSRDDRDRIGLHWPASFGAGSVSASYDLTSGSWTEASAAVTEQALPRLDFARAQGWAKLLREAALITANGEEATFAGGGEVNLPVESALSVGIRQIVFGSTVRVRPRYDRDSGRIELTIHAEVSDLASDHGSGVPGRVTATLDSVVNLELGQSLVLAGLSAHSEASTQSGLPVLAQIPLIGALFGSTEHRTERSENLIFIVPTVVDAVPLDARERVREALELFHEYEGEIDGQPLRRQGAAPRREAR